MGYFKRPIRRSAARQTRLAFLEPAREICPADWKQCDLSRPPAAESFLRFVIEHPRAGKVGLFRSSRVIERPDALPTAAAEELRTVFRWFNHNLPVPSRMPRNAICWLRSDAAESLKRLRTLVDLYQLAGYPVWMQTTQTPGRVVYRDDYQIAAVPYADRPSTISAV